MSLVGKTLGTYHILQELGRGNLGSVYKGHNPQLDRYVAIKVLDAHLTPEPEQVQHFLDELQTLTRIYHPHIVTLHAIGQEGNQCYLARAYIEGGSLAERIEQKGPLFLNQVIEIARQLASALDYAHKHGKVHGDLQPADILLDAADRVVLANLGLVPALERTHPAGPGPIRGTTLYMAPERLLGTATTAASDLYSLGAVLYHMLSGEPPFQDTTEQQSAEAPRPLRARGAEVPEAVEWVIHWALARDPDQRPSNAGELLSALRDAAGGQLSENVLAEISRAQAPQEPPVAPPEAEPIREEDPWLTLEGQARAHEEADRWAEAAATWRQLYAMAWRHFYEQVRERLDDSQPEHAEQPDAGAFQPRPREEEKWRLARLETRPTTELSHRLPGMGGDLPGILALAFSPNGEWLVSAGEGGYLWLWSIVHEDMIRLWEGHEGDIWSLAISPDSQLLASASEDGTVALWNLQTGEELRRLTEFEGPVNTVAFTPTSSLLLSGGDDGLVYLWQAQTGEKKLVVMPGHSQPVYGVACSPNEEFLASASEDGTVALWKAQTGDLVRRWTAERGALNSVVFAPDGSTLAAGGEDGSIYLWDVATGQEIRRLEGHSEQITTLSFSADGSLLASASADSTIRLWSAWYGWEIDLLERHSDWVNAVAFAPDGSLLASASYDGTAWLWVLVEGGRR